MLSPVIIWDDTTNKSINTKQMKEKARAPSMNQDWKHHVAMFWLCCCCVWTLDEWLPAIAYISSCSRSICSKIHLFLSLSGTFFVGIQLHDLLYTLDFCTHNLYGYVVQCMCVCDHIYAWKICLGLLVFQIRLEGFTREAELHVTELQMS